VLTKRLIITGILSGASFINEKLEELIVNKLSTVKYVFRDGRTAKSIAQAKAIQFENGQKRTIDVTERAPRIAPITISGLKENESKGLGRGHIQLDK
jgi:hypothetical protein